MSGFADNVRRLINLEVLAVGAGVHASLGVVGLVPITIGVLVDGYGISLQLAGIYASIQIIAVSLAALAIAPIVGNFSNSRLAILGSSLIVIGNLVAAISSTPTILVSALAVAGVGFGTVGAGTNASVASAKEPEKLYASAILVYAIAGSTILFVLPMLYVGIAYPMYFVFHAVLNGLVMFLYPKLPSSQGSIVRVVTESLTSKFAQLVNARTVPLFAGSLAIWLAMGIIWGVSERMGVHLGMSPQAAAYSLLASNIFGMAGSVLARIIGERYGRTKPLFLGSVILGLSFYWIGNAPFASIYVGSLIVFGVGYYYLLPYIMGVAAELDSDGKVAAFNGAMPAVSHIISPALGAYIAAEVSFGATGTTSFLVAVVAAFLFLPCTLYLDRAERKKTALSTQLD
jgi:MFS family permease